MADIEIQKFIDKLNGQTDPAAHLVNAPRQGLEDAAREVGSARTDTTLPRVSDELIDQVTGATRPRDLTGILTNSARAVDRQPDAAKAVASGDALRGVAQERTHLIGFVAAGAAVQQFGAFGQTAIAETLDTDLRSFFSTCEKVLADPQSPPALRTQATTALLTYKGQLAMLASLRESVSAHQRAVAAEAEARLQLSAEAADKLAQVNDFLARNKG